MEKISLNGDDWMLKEYLDEDWVWRNAQKRGTRDVRWWKKAQVPGCVAEDLHRAGLFPDPYFEKNSLLIEWIPERTWVYRKSFSVPESLRGKRVFLHFEGIDYDAQIYLNEKRIGEHHSMFTPAVFDVTGLIEYDDTENLLAVVLEKAPREQSQVSKTRYVRTHKCRMTYWWDFCPRMIHLGIWEEVWLEFVEDVRIRQVTFDVKVEEGLAAAKIEGTICLEKADIVGIKLVDRDGQVVSEKSLTVNADGGERLSFELCLDNPKLWWPNGYGEQYLYLLRVTARSLRGEEAVYETPLGVRSLVFTANENSDPTARAYTACINGESIYLKGYNWVPMDVMYGHKRPEKLRRLLELAAEAHVNCLRVWGGGLIETEEFYTLCDQLGILIWQEFIQSSSGIENEPSRDSEFLLMMEREARAIIPRKKKHPRLLSGEEEMNCRVRTER